MIIVPAAGPQPCDVLLCGEAPGREESIRGIPFCGPSGREQETHLARHGINVRQWRRTNVCQEYRESNPDPTPEQIAYWTPHLLDEIAKTNPKLLVAVGRFAARFFLGDETELEAVHGLPHRAGAFDSTRANRAPQGCVVLPVYHPALGLYDNDKKALIAWDHGRVADTYKAIRAGRAIEFREDELAGNEIYLDISGQDLADQLAKYPPAVVALDTEGSPDDPWSLQVSDAPGWGYTLRREREDFSTGILALAQAAENGTAIVMHNAMFDLEMCRAMGLDLFNATIYDTLYAAYLMRVETQDSGRGRKGLKLLAWRWCGMRMKSHAEVTDPIRVERQIDYLNQVLAREWPKPEPQVIIENDGRARLYKPQPIEKRVEKILLDVYTGKADKDGELTDPRARWLQVDKTLRAPIEKELGEIPYGSVKALAEVDFDAAIRYASRDADATLRLYYQLSKEIERLGLQQLMADGMEVLPVFEEMQATGLPARREHFEALRDEMWDAMCRLQSRISTTWYGGKPFNPGSPKQVATLLRRRGLRGEKTTSTGQMSTGKQSIEHLRYTDEAIAAVIDWREHQHVKDAFCDPILDRMPEESGIHDVRCQLKVTRTATRRLASTNPNLLAMPSRKEIGRRIRDGFQCEVGELLGGWDLSQIESRVLAHESRDPLLCELFNTGQDIHIETAARIFRIPREQVTKDQRTSAKTINYGVIYGLQASGLATQLRMLPGLEGWTERECERMLVEWFKVYAGVKAYADRVVQEVKRDGIVRDCWGMPRYLPGIWSDDRKTAAEAGRIAVSHRIQGGAQGMIQRSIAYLKPFIRAMQDAGLNVHWCLQVHDEIIMRFDEELWDTVNPLVLEALTQHCGIQLSVPVEAEGHAAKSWGRLK